MDSYSRPEVSGCGLSCTAIAMDIVAIGDEMASDVTFEVVSTCGRSCLNQVTYRCNNNRKNVTEILGM